MPKGKKRHLRRVSNLIFIFTFITILFSVSTYAWFVGMQVVNVSSFDIEIATTESLVLSLDGRRWDTTVYISQNDLNDVSYTGHTNKWTSLIPMSSIGAMEYSASRMKLYEKSSLTPTAGGHRLLASRVDNYTADRPEQDGYVVFDLFIKNISGTKYFKENDPLNEEAIYLTVDSKVTGGADGAPNTGIENSVRVAFAQIGRVAATITDPDIITEIDCAIGEEGEPTIKGDVTGICRPAKIWEPNDKAHDSNAIKYYNTSCKKRNGEDVTKPASYSGACNTISDESAYTTYAVSTEIEEYFNADIYDGPAYNGWTGNSLLVAYPYFTDTQKDLSSTQRPQFMSLAPSSITKVRIYVYIEGQDVDNYDFASIGKKITVNFGFTKQRFEEGDTGYEGPPYTRPGTDTEKPVIHLLGDDEVTVPFGATYIDAGATASDDVDGDITNWIKVTNPVDTSKAGTYIIAYDVLDWAGNYAERVTRTVTVEEEQ